MGKRKKTPVKRPSLKTPVKFRTLQRGHDGSFQTRKEIAVLAQRGLPPSHIVKALGVTFDMAQREGPHDYYRLHRFRSRGLSRFSGQQY